MTGTALARVQTFPARFSSIVFRQGSCPCEIVGIDVENSGFWVESRSAPFGATVESWEHHGILSDAKGNKLSLVTKFPKVFQRPLMRLSSAAGQHILGKNLARKGSGSGRQRLFGGSDFAGYRARRILAILDREERFASSPVK